MPQAVDLVVKNGASTPVDKTFVLLSPAPGYGQQAEWALKEGTAAVEFPTFTAASTKTRNKSRKVVTKFRVPVYNRDTTTQLLVPVASFEAHVEVTIPDAFPEDKKPDAVAYTVNLLNTALLKAMFKDGYPAT